MFRLFVIYFKVLINDHLFVESLLLVGHVVYELLVLMKHLVVVVVFVKSVEQLDSILNQIAL